MSSESCAYYPTVQIPGMPATTAPWSRRTGCFRLPASQSDGYLDSPAMLLARNPWRSAEQQAPPCQQNVTTTLIFTNLFSDCATDPEEQLSLPRMMSHAGQFAPDGRTLRRHWDSHASQIPAARRLLLCRRYSRSTRAIRRIRGMATWLAPKEQWMTHSVSISKNGPGLCGSSCGHTNDQQSHPCERAGDMDSATFRPGARPAVSAHQHVFWRRPRRAVSYL